MSRMSARLQLTRTLSTFSFQFPHRSISGSCVRLQKHKRPNPKPKPKKIVNKGNRNSSFDLFIKRLIEEKGIEPGVTAIPESSVVENEELGGSTQGMSEDFDLHSDEEEEEETSQALHTPPLFILAGSSNMGGRGRPDKLPEDICPSTHETKAPLPSTFGTIDFRMCYSVDSHLTPRGGSSSSHHFVPLKSQAGVCGHRIGPEFGIAKSLGSRLTMHVQQAYFLKFTLDQSNLHHNWHPRNKRQFGHRDGIGHFKSFIEFCKRHTLEEFRRAEAVARPPRYKLAGVFWLQGESDAAVKDHADRYLDNFQQFVKAVRNRLKAPDLPFVVSPIVGVGPFVDIVNQQLHLAGSGAVPNCFCVENVSPQFGVETKGAATQWLTTAGVTDVGKRMAAAMPLQNGMVAKS